MSEDSNTYEKKMKYKSIAEGKRLKPTKRNKKGKQSIKNDLKTIDINRCSTEDDFSDINDFYWGED